VGIKMARVEKNAGQDPIAEIRKNLEGKKLVLGTERTMKSLRLGRLEKVYITSNCPEGVRQDLAHYNGIGKVELVQLGVPNDELGVMCKKPFSISVAGLLRV
jgi:large subunit ribosomal protein L30e